MLLDADMADTLSASAPTPNILRGPAPLRKAQDSGRFAGRPVDRHRRNERRNRLSDGPFSPHMLTWPI